jgi:fibronectin type 3 domain-containing protein
LIEELQWDVVAISAGNNFSLALTEENVAFGTEADVFAFGNGSLGQLGLGADLTNKFIPTVIPGLSGKDVAAISAGSDYALALTHDGDVYSFGDNFSGRLGHDDFVSRHEPEKIIALDGKNVTAISAGGHSIVLTDEGEAYSFGYGLNGQLGTGVQNEKKLPTKVVGLSNVSSISAGFYHSVLNGSVDNTLTYSAGLSVSDSVDFYPLLLGYTTSLSQTVTVTNTGTGDVTGLLASIGGTHASSFEFVGSTPSSVIAPGSSTPFYVRPKLGLAAGNYEANVTVAANNGISQTFAVRVTVTAVPTYTIAVTPSDLIFPAQAEGYSAQSGVNVTVARTGTGDIRNMSVTLEGDNPDSFMMGSQAPGEILLNSGIKSFYITLRPKQGLTLGTYGAIVRIRGDNGVDENVNLSFTVNSAPRLTDQPDSITVDEGSQAVFSATAEGTAPLTYQWQVDSGSGFADLVGEESTSLTIPSVTPDMSGNEYRVVVSGALTPAATSTAAILTVNAIPAKPVISGVIPSDGQIRLNWTAVAGTTGYNIYVSTSPGSNSVPVTVENSVSSYDITELTNGTTYYIAMSAINGVLESPLSDEASATPQVAAPEAPVIQTATVGNATVALAWSEVVGATGYTIYQSTDSADNGLAVETVAGSIYEYQVSGLTNGINYYFVITANNPGGVSNISNKVSATPITVPEAPSNVTAVAGNRQATVSFEIPADNGGNTITGYEVRSTPGDIVATGESSPIVVTGLTNGVVYTFTVRAINGAGASVSSAVSNEIVLSAPPVYVDPGNPTPQTSTVTIDILVNGVSQSIGSATKTEKNGIVSVTLVVDEQKLQDKVQSEGKGAVITVPVMLESDEVIVSYNGTIVEYMVDMEATLLIETEQGTYTLPASLIDLEGIRDRIGSSTELGDLKLEIKLSAPTDQQLELLEVASEKEFLTLLGSAVNYSVSISHLGESYEIKEFTSYVERSIALPDDLDPEQITTGVVVGEDGDVRHVPTYIQKKNGKNHAILNSLTNSLYALVSYPVSYEDLSGHWAEESVHNMGSRLVVQSTSSGLFLPNDNITRAEFAAIVVRTLGLDTEYVDHPFSDIAHSNPYSGVIATAYVYGLLSGYTDGTFRPDGLISREQAMSVVARAMIVAELPATPDAEQAKAALSLYEDASDISTWARDSVAANLLSGIVNGRSEERLAPGATMTRAEAAVIVRRLLQFGNLIE